MEPGATASATPRHGVRGVARPPSRLGCHEGWPRRLFKTHPGPQERIHPTRIRHRLTVAIPILGAHDSRRTRSLQPYRLHPSQPGQAWLVQDARPMGFFEHPSAHLATPWPIAHHPGMTIEQKKLRERANRLLNAEDRDERRRPGHPLSPSSIRPTSHPPTSMDEDDAGAKTTPTTHPPGRASLLFGLPHASRNASWIPLSHAKPIRSASAFRS